MKRRTYTPQEIAARKSAAYAILRGAPSADIIFSELFSTEGGADKERRTFTEEEINAREALIFATLRAVKVPPPPEKERTNEGPPEEG